MPVIIYNKVKNKGEYMKNYDYFELAEENDVYDWVESNLEDGWDYDFLNNVKKEDLDKVSKDEVYRELEKFKINDVESFLRKKKMEKIGKKN